MGEFIGQHKGEVTINAPGVQMRINIPEGLRHEASIHDDSGLVYPGSTMSGMHTSGFAGVYVVRAKRRSRCCPIGRRLQGKVALRINYY